MPLNSELGKVIVDGKLYWKLRADNTTMAICHELAMIGNTLNVIQFCLVPVDGEDV